MDEFKIKCYITDDKDENIELSKLSKEELHEWKQEMEARALSQLYKQKIKIVTDKI